MAGYRELNVWKIGIEITKDVYTLTESFPKAELYGLTSQMRRCAVSIPSNIAEGHSRETTRELARFAGIAKGSLAELETPLIIAKELGYGTPELIHDLLQLAEREGRMLSGLRRSLSTNTKN